MKGKLQKNGLIKLKKEPACFAEIRQKIVMMGDLHGGFHLLKLETWIEIATDFTPKKYLPAIIKELRSADKHRTKVMSEKIDSPFAI